MSGVDGMVSQEEFQALTRRVAELESLTKQLASSLAKVQQQANPLSTVESGKNVESLTTDLAAATMKDASSLPQIISSDRDYEYASVQASRSEIRILGVQKSDDFNAPLMARLVTASLDSLQVHSEQMRASQIAKLASKGEASHEHFQALSYTWGDPGKRGTIYIDGRKLDITHSLETALRHMRRIASQPQIDPRFIKFGKKVYLSQVPRESFWWVDAICINQQDVDEKNHQVSQMTRLYKKAAGVSVWLGDEANDSDFAMTAVQQLGYRPALNKTEIENWNYIRRGNETHRPGGPGELPVELPKEDEVSNEDRARLQVALSAFFARPWFVRAWIRQEIALPPTISIHCGTQTCSWEELARAASVLAYMSNFSTPSLLATAQDASVRERAAISSMGIRHMNELVMIRVSTGSSHNTYLSFAELIKQAKQCDATDARDKVFSLLGMTDPTYVTSQPDYRSDDAKAWRRAVLDLLPISLDFFGACQHPERPDGLPSWVPHMTRPSRTTSFPCRRRFGANPDIPSQPVCRNNDARPRFKLSSDQTTLELHGWHVDTIELLCPSQAGLTLSPEACINLKNEWLQWLVANLTSKRYVSEETLDDFLSELKSDDHSVTAEVASQNKVVFEPMRGRPLHQDPAFRTATRLLLDTSTSAPQEPASRIVMTMRVIAPGRRLVTTTTGWIGLVPDVTELGDEVVVFPGCSWAHCIRRVSGDDHVLVGEAAIDALKHRSSEWVNPSNERVFHLV